MAPSVKATDDNKLQIKKILVPIDCSDYSFNAAKYATKLAKDKNAQLVKNASISGTITFAPKTFSETAGGHTPAGG